MARRINRITIEGYSRDRHQLAFRYAADDLRFSTSLWYGETDLVDLESHFGRDFMERIYFHIAASDASKLVSLAPAELDMGPFARFTTEAFAALWQAIIYGVWAQWRYQHQRPDYLGPRIVNPLQPGSEPVEITGGDVDYLCFCGGGKDSLVMANLLEGARAPYASFAYAGSSYGRSGQQHALIDGLLDTRTPVRRHRQWVFDDFVDSPIVDLGGVEGLRELTAAETPASIFAALPVLLAHGYRHLVLGHEASANVGNLVWDATGEDVNHQWGKSAAAETLINSYLASELIGNASYFSVLQPVHDPVIFYLLNRSLDSIGKTHSCNVHKPWCMRCPKCAYVWLGYQAYLPGDRLELPGPNPLDLPENAGWYRDMIGLSEHTPFECIGQIDESRLALALVRAKGIRGRAIDDLFDELGPLDLDAIERRYLTVADESSAPPDLAASLLAQMREAAGECRSHVRSILG